MDKRFNWEALYEHEESDMGVGVFRAKVPGGWIVFHTAWRQHGVYTQKESMCFIPDPNHEWDGQTLE